MVQYRTGLGDADVSPTTAPLDVADRATLVGKYMYRPGPRDHFTIEVRRDLLGRDQLTIERAGVPSAKITQLTVADPNVIR